MIARGSVLGRKVYKYYAAHGLLKTVVRVSEVSLRALGVPAYGQVTPRNDGLATLQVSTEPANLAQRVTPVSLACGRAVVQRLPTGIASIYALSFRFGSAPGSTAGQAEVLVVSEDGRRLHSERLDVSNPRAGGCHVLSLRRELAIPVDSPQTYLILRAVGNNGASPALTVFRNDSATGLAEIDLDDLSLLATALKSSCAGAGPREGGLVYRMSAHSTLAFAQYHRPGPEPQRPTTPAVGRTVYVVGAGVPPALTASPCTRWGVIAVDSTLLSVDDLDPDRHVVAMTPSVPVQRAQEIVRRCHASYVPVIAYIPARVNGSAWGADIEALVGVEQLLAWSDAAMTDDPAVLEVNRSRARRWLTLNMRHATDDIVDAIEAWLPHYRRTVLPKITIVSVLYGKSEQIDDVLQSYFRQTYSGEVEVIFVDDCDPQDTALRVERAFRRARERAPGTRLPSCKIVRNPRNLGNCISRNAGLSPASGDIVVIIDADCLLNRDFLRRHAEAHSFGDCDVVVGPVNIETESRPPLPYLSELEARPHLVAQRSQPQDEYNQTSFLNCITRNFSIRRDFIEGQLFDPAFSYSTDPAAGFGWEDVEMGYRLYLRGARIKYVSDAFSVHITHPSSIPERDKPVRSLRNFRRLIEKHPGIPLEARRWVLGTYTEIKKWFDYHEIPHNQDIAFLDRVLLNPPAERPAIPLRRFGARKLRILSCRWHVPHQYEIYKLPHEFHLLNDLGSPMTHSWEFGHRPLPDNVVFRSARSVRQRDYDLAIVHFDENVLSPENTNGVLGPDWGAAFRWFMDNIGLPKIAVCHGTPQFYGQYNFHYCGPDLMQVIEPARRKLVAYLGDTHVVCNSHQAQREWGFARSSVIWHGFDPTEFPPATYERGILSPLGPLVLSRPHYRGYFLYRQVFAGFPAQFAPSSLRVPCPSPLYEGNQYAVWKYRNYVDEIRRFSLYFNPTLRSPMPRSRAEPMMCGVVTVNAKNHDVDMFIQNGVNGFYSSDPGELREYLLYLCRHPAVVRKIGAEARRTATRIFNHDRFLADWTRLIASVTS
jgi:glycosyltransferase involved in cell wall biosynthesis